MLVEEIHSPWILGSLAIFTPSLTMAHKVYDIVIGYTDDESFGTVFFENDEEIDWVDISFRAVRNGRLR